MSDSNDLRPRASIVVPFFNRRDDVRTCLRSLLRQDATSFEIVAVDNGSSDGTLEELERIAALRPGTLRVVREATPGPAAARNAGARAARGDWLVFIDSDCVAHPSCARELLRAADANPAALAVGGRILPRLLETGAETFSHLYGVLDQKRFFRGLRGAPPGFATACCAVRKEAFERIGGFDESMRYGEDADLCWRLLDLDGSLVYTPLAMVRHRHRRTLAGLHRQAEGYGRGYVDLFSKHRDRLGWRREVDWLAWFGLAMMPLLFVADNVRPREHPFHRRFRLYEAIWLSGYLAGRIRRSIQRRVFCI